MCVGGSSFGAVTSWKLKPSTISVGWFGVDKPSGSTCHMVQFPARIENQHVRRARRSAQTTLTYPCTKMHKQKLTTYRPNLHARAHDRSSQRGTHDHHRRASASSAHRPRPAALARRATTRPAAGVASSRVDQQALQQTRRGGGHAWAAPARRASLVARCVRTPTRQRLWRLSSYWRQPPRGR